jgi:hypothetical protein
LSWIADGLKTADGSLSLETLSLKGTRVTLTSLKGIQDAFLYSSLRCNDSYLGAWPLSRVDDRKAINHYHKRGCAATKIQALVRSSHEKETLQRAREEHAKKRVAVRIGALLRRRKARELFKKLKLTRKKQQASSIKMQCAFRCYLSKKALERLYKQKIDMLKPHSSITIQKHYRGVLGRRKAAKVKRQAMLEAERRLRAIVQLQGWSRMLIARRLKAALQYQFLRNEAKRIRAAVSIQSIWRRYTANQALVKQKAAFTEQQQRKIAAVSKLYGIFRQFLFKKVVEVRVFKSKERARCALAIQRWYRRMEEDKRRRIISERVELALRVDATVLIQRNLRKRAAYLLFLAEKKRRDIMLTLREEKAQVICHFGRLCIAKNLMRRRQEEFDEEVKRVYMFRMWASTKIAAAWRGKVGRDIANNARMLRAQRWKALWSQEHGMAFYYNLDTGETRWEKPQVLLDLEPKPVCSNCFEFQAEMECCECEEFYCTRCFECIHLGGRRALHHFKCVFDFYGRRKDLNLEQWISLQDTQGKMKKLQIN